MRLFMTILARAVVCLLNYQSTWYCYGNFPSQIANIIQDLQELHAHTPQEHVDYDTLQELRDDLNDIQKVSTTYPPVAIILPFYSISWNITHPPLPLLCRQ